MAVVSQPFNRKDADRRVRHPLQTIRGHIRRYVLTEGISLAILYTAVCLWVGLAVDFTLWSTLSFDWLYTFNGLTGNGVTIGLRTVILLVVLAGLMLLISLKIFGAFSRNSATLPWPCCWSGAIPGSLAIASSPPSNWPTPGLPKNMATHR